jgi:hypothetical protein
MMKFRMLLPMFLLMLPVFAACSDGTGAPAPSPTPTMTPEPLSTDEEAALEAARAFLVAWEAGDRAALTATLSSQWLSGSGRDWVDVLGGTAEVRVVSVRIERSRPAAPGTVTFGVDLEVTPADGNSPWNQGVNTRFIQLASEGGSWKVAGLGG